MKYLDKQKNFFLTSFAFVLLTLFLNGEANAKKPVSVKFATSNGRISFKDTALYPLQLHGLLFEADKPRALLLAVHGLQSHSAWFFSGDELSESGITVLAFDRRGSGLSEGIRGHANSKEDFYNDLKAATQFLKKKYPDLPLHLHANCFGSRSAIPFAENNKGLFRSMILTAPATAMSPEADYSLSDKLSCISKSFGLGMLVNPLANCNHLKGSSPQYVKTPIRDELFVKQGSYLDWIKNDSNSIREVTVGFLASVNALNQDFEAMTTDKSGGFLDENSYVINTPTLVVVGAQDRMVNNQKIKRDFFESHLNNESEFVRYNCEHWLESCPESELAKYREKMIQWILK